jgi:hypothetical protein
VRGFEEEGVGVSCSLSMEVTSVVAGFTSLNSSSNGYAVTFTASAERDHDGKSLSLCSIPKDRFFRETSVSIFSP